MPSNKECHWLLAVQIPDLFKKSGILAFTSTRRQEAEGKKEGCKVERNYTKSGYCGVLIKIPKSFPDKGFDFF
ncbi:MAG: hypothetical protein F6K14_02845 [Symploca sp. SIO2C1]|nr:hypothetical protein [Symploca sp. SIO2C1]